MQVLSKTTVLNKYTYFCITSFENSIKLATHRTIILLAV